MVNKRKSALYGIILALIIILLAIGIAKVGSLSVVEDRDVYQPIYLSASCKPIDGLDNKIINVDTHTDAPTWYYCDDTESNTFIPDGESCEYELYNAGAASIVYVCDGKTTNKEDLKTSKCVKKSGIFSADRTAISVDAGDSIYINSIRAFGEADLNVRYPAYGLQVETSTGYDMRTTKDCLFRGAKTYNEHTINKLTTIVRDRKNREVVAINKPLNMVQGQTNVRGSGQVVSLKDVENGKLIYIIEANKYYMVETADDGFLYVDTLKAPKTDKDIECIPRTQLGAKSCSDEAKLVDASGVSCSTWSGSFTGYNPSSKPGQYCTYECKDNKPVETADCKKVQGECPNDKPYWNFDKQSCEGQLQQTPKTITGFPIEYVLLVSGIFLIILLMIVIKVKGKR